MTAAKPTPEELSMLVEGNCEPLPSIDHESFARHFDRFGQAKVVLIGDARYYSTSPFHANIMFYCLTHMGGIC